MYLQTHIEATSELLDVCLYLPGLFFKFFHFLYFSNDYISVIVEVELNESVYSFFMVQYLHVTFAQATVPGVYNKLWLQTELIIHWKSYVGEYETGLPLSV